MEIEKLNLSVRSYIILIKNSIKTIEQFLKLTIDDLNKMRFLGTRQKLEILFKQQEYRNLSNGFTEI